MARKTAPTIYDVASTAGVSISTVSRVLNNPEKVNEETRSVVLEAINQLGFVPKAEARARALQQNRRIGVLSPFFTAPSFVQRLRGAASALQSTNYELVIYTVDSASVMNNYLETLPLTGNLDGLLVLSLQFDNKYAQHIAEYELETVLVEYPHNILSSVEIDNASGGQMAADFLFSRGHTRLGFAGDTVVPEFGVHPITQRLQGFRETLLQNGVSLLDEDIMLVPYDVEMTRKTALEYLQRPERPTAIFAATDLQAIGILKAARDLGLHVPADLAVMGFDDLDVADFMGLTTIRQYLDESGRIAIELLLSRIANPGRAIQHIKLPLSLVERETV